MLSKEQKVEAFIGFAMFNIMRHIFKKYKFNLKLSSVMIFPGIAWAINYSTRKIIMNQYKLNKEKKEKNGIAEGYCNMDKQYFYLK